MIQVHKMITLGISDKWLDSNHYSSKLCFIGQHEIITSGITNKAKAGKLDFCAERIFTLSSDKLNQTFHLIIQAIIEPKIKVIDKRTQIKDRSYIQKTSWEKIIPFGIKQRSW